MPRNPTRQSISQAEHSCFGELQNAMSLAHDRALQMSRLRRDQRDGWEKIAVLFKAVEGQVMDLATQGMFTREDGKFSGGPMKH